MKRPSGFDTINHLISWQSFGGEGFGNVACHNAKRTCIRYFLITISNNSRSLSHKIFLAHFADKLQQDTVSNRFCLSA